MRGGSVVLMLLWGCGDSGGSRALPFDATGDGPVAVTTFAGDTRGSDAAGGVPAVAADAAAQALPALSDAATDTSTVGGQTDAPRASDAAPMADTILLSSDAAPAACKVPGVCDPFGANICPIGQICRSNAGVAACLRQIGVVKGDGDLCGGSDCDQGLTCLPDDDNKTRCFRVCAMGSRGSCGADKRCAIRIGGESCLMACRPQPRACDIYEPACADPVQACHPTQDPETAQLYTGCQAAGPRTEGQACQRFGDCGRGLFCVSSLCRRVCKPGGTPSCEAPQACTGMSIAYRITFCQ